MTKASEEVTRFRVKRRARIREYLGSKCIECGTTEGELHADHIDPSTKSFVISQNLQLRWETIVEELKKCQLLCVECHAKKTAIEIQQRFKETTHCRNGHLLTPDNTRILRNGTRRCRECIRAYQRRVRKTERQRGE